jgi:hypothetical protein
MRSAVCIALAVLLSACAHGSLWGDPIKLAAVPKPGDQLLVPPGAVAWVHKGGAMRAYSVRVGRMHFSVDVPSGRSEIVFVSTTDRRFRTPDNVRIGDSWPSVAKAQGKPLPSEIQGLSGCTVRLPSGWDAEFQEDCGTLNARSTVGQLDLRSAGGGISVLSSEF